MRKQTLSKHPLLCGTENSILRESTFLRGGFSWKKTNKPSDQLSNDATQSFEGFSPSKFSNTLPQCNSIRYDDKQIIQHHFYLAAECYNIIMLICVRSPMQISSASTKEMKLKTSTLPPQLWTVIKTVLTSLLSK